MSFDWLPWQAIAAFTVVAVAWCRYLDPRRSKKPVEPKPWPGSKETRFTAVYGAYLAAQVTDRFQRGQGAPDATTMAHFVREARAVAELAEESE